VDAAETLNPDFAKIHDWSMKWLVKFNPDKTESTLRDTRTNIPPVRATTVYNNPLFYIQ
jgi:hypothetical protein